MGKPTTNQKNTRRGGMYFLPGESRPFLTVTKILSVISKPQLLFWACGLVYDEFLINPSLDRKDALSMPRKTSQKAMDRGTTIHDVVEAYKNNAPRITTIPALQGYVTAFYKWVDDNQVELVEQERTVFSRQFWYAGTFDMKVRLNGKSDIWLIDLKTSKDIYKEYELQLSAYKQAATEMGETVDRMGVLLVGEDSTYRFEEKVFTIEPFLAAKRLYEWEHETQLKKYGYFPN